MCERIDRRQFLVRGIGVVGAASLGALSGSRVLAQATRPGAATQRETMRRRVIPGTEEKLPVVGLGTWRQFDPDQVDAAKLAQLKRVLAVLHEMDGRVVDSSPMYGKSERIVGQLTTELEINDELFFATKVWQRGEAAGVEQMQASMEKMQRDTIDLMQVHNLVDWRTHLETLKQWKKEGKVRYIGVTHHQVSSFDALREIMVDEDVDFVQLPYSVVTRSAEVELLPTARETGTAVLVNRPFEGGRLFGLVQDTALPNQFQAFADTWAQAFLKFILAQPVVTVVIPGTSDPKHMRDNAGAGYGRLPTKDECAALADVMAARWRMK